MPNSPHPLFQQTLRHAVKRFIQLKSPLWVHQQEEVAEVMLIIDNKQQTDRQLRDRLKETCKVINSRWRHFIVSSLLTDFIEEVLTDPRFNVEHLYESYLEAKDKTIAEQAEVIEKLTKANHQLMHNLPSYVIDLQEKLAQTQISLTKAQHQQAESEKLLQQQRETLELMQRKLVERDQHYQHLLQEYFETLNRQSANRKSVFIPLGVMRTEDNSSHLSRTAAPLNPS